MFILHFTEVSCNRELFHNSFLVGFVLENLPSVALPSYLRSNYRSQRNIESQRLEKSTGLNHQSGKIWGLFCG